MAKWEQVQQNTTLHPKALLLGEGVKLRWHDNADLAHSSQVFCISAFGTVRHLTSKNKILDQLLGIPGDLAESWQIELEYEQPDLLSEYGNYQPSSVDVLLQNSKAIVCVESKFLSDAKSGFGGCSQPKKQCAGFYGPGSDIKTGTNAWCRLEVWDGDRSPRTYWTLGKAFFQESVFRKQENGEDCPFSGSNYQLMRNFLFAAALAQKEKVPTFGVVVFVPKRMTRKLEEQIDDFRTKILQPQFGHTVRLLHYERLIELLQETNATDELDLANFLSDRIAQLIA